MQAQNTSLKKFKMNCVSHKFYSNICHMNLNIDHIILSTNTMTQNWWWSFLDQNPKK